ncbi:MAG: potassium-transporting ATPase subunit KdpA [Candidatus Palauibacterales bacterium]|nr:potassium-transporting ATPase subunit KdpA [Candidatus Palauibacterales bacterium]MDP2584175.1 potassium-transporting ATPase subunit KdpA [Candidatus Palauibacterales bacterium]
MATRFITPAIWLVAVLVLAWPLGKYMAGLMDESTAGRARPRGGLESALRRALGPAWDTDQDWKAYVVSMLAFNAVMFGVAFLVLLLQRWLPLDPDGKGALEPSLIFNTVASFTSNTNLQHYAGEQAMSYFSQLFALMWLQFVSAATGIAALAGLSRALGGRTKIGNFYRDVSRATFFLLLPLALVLGVILAVLGIPMTLHGAAVAHTLEGAVQTIARGPVAAFVAIKQLGTNGGGFFGPNSTHPFENPTYWTNVIENGAILLVPMACVWMFGRLAGRLRDAVVILAVMGILLVGGITAANRLEARETPALTTLPVRKAPENLEGKELRFGAGAGPTWAVSTTATSNGSVDAMHDSLNPLTGLVPMVGMWLNVIFGGVGVGMINMFLFIVVAVFIAGMMVGRTPEYLTRKVEAREMKLALLALLIHPLFILGGTALFAATSWGTHTVLNAASHGFSEILYEFSSATANNGSGFEGLGDHTIPWNVSTGLVMLLARFIPIIAPLAIGGSLAAKKPTPETSGTFRTDGWLFGAVLLGTVLIVGALLFMPVAVLGPIAEHLSLGGAR